MLNELEDRMSELASAFIGALVGGLFTLLGIKIEGSREQKIKDAESISKKMNILKGIRTEISLLTKLYDTRVGESIRNHKAGEVFDVSFYVKQNNFVFYEANAIFLSELSDSCQESIVEFYLICKSLIDTYNMHNDIIKMIHEITLKLAFDYENEMLRKLLESYMEIAKDYAPCILEIHYEAIRKSISTIEIIDKELHALGNQK